MILWCAGMYASGSTWAYNTMRAIAAELHPAAPVKGRFVNIITDMAGIEDGSAVQVVKSHDTEADVAAALLAAARSIVVTIRDPRDAVTSLMAYQRFPFAMALEWVARSARFCAARVDDPRALLLRYEAGFPDDPATLDRIAAAFGGTLPPARRDALFAQSRRDAVEKLIGGLENLPNAQRHAPSGDIFDPETQWHRHHARRNGEIGRWRRMLTPAQVATVEAELAAWLQRFDYPKAPPVAAYTLNLGNVTFKA